MRDRHAGRVVRGLCGVTLLELLVVLTVLGVVLGITGLAFAALRAPRGGERALEIKQVRAEAIRAGAPRTTQHARFLPDGRAIGPGVDPLTGAPLAK